MDLILDTYRFGNFRLDPSRRLLSCDGAPVALSPRAFDLLLVLLEGRDRVLSRAEIMAAVWPGVVVEEHNLSVQISKLRRALGDTNDEARTIATIPGRGYRFVAVLDQAEASPPAPLPLAELLPAPAIEPREAPALGRPRRARLAMAVGVTLATAGALLWWRAELRRPQAPPLSIVVMPLRDLSDKPGQTYLADAISDDLTTDLSHLPGSTVIARETADSFRSHAATASEIGRALRVRYLLEGSLRSEGLALHVNAQLIETARGGHLWAQSFDVPRTDLALAREAIVRRIAASLNVELVQAESRRSLRDRPDDPTALDLFFQARSILDHDDSLAGFRKAQSLLEHAIALQPDFADALAALSVALMRKSNLDDPDAQSDLARARTLIARALAASPENTGALVARAQLLYLDRHVEEAAYTARAALGSEPTNLDAQAVLAHCAWDRGQLEEAADALLTILRIDPEGAANKSRLILLGNVRLLQGRITEAIDLVQRAVAGDPAPEPGMDSWGRAEGARMLLIAAYALQGQVQTARSLYASYAELWPHRTVWRINAWATRAQAQLPGWAKFMGALHAAGMPLAADEHADDHVEATAKPVAAAYFAPTPTHLPGATTIDTAQLAEMRRRDPNLLIVDLGRASACVPGSIWRTPAEQSLDDTIFLEHALRKAGGGKDGKVVVLSDGTYYTQSQNGVLQLVARGYGHVFWYRGGEEAWAAAGMPAEDHRD